MPHDDAPILRDKYGRPVEVGEPWAWGPKVLNTLCIIASAAIGAGLGRLAGLALVWGWGV